MKKKCIIMIIIILIIIMDGCLINMSNFSLGSNTAFYKTVTSYPNTMWICEEIDASIIVKGDTYAEETILSVNDNGINDKYHVYTLADKLELCRLDDSGNEVNNEIYEGNENVILTTAKYRKNIFGQVTSFQITVRDGEYPIAGHKILRFVKSDNNETIKIAIYPVGTYNESYCFELMPNRNLFVEQGVRTGEELTKSPFIQREAPYDSYFQSKKTRLTKSEFEKIHSLTDDILNTIYTENIPNEGVVFDSWSIQILYKEKTTIQDCFNEDLPQIKKLIEELSSVSPLEVDLHDWT